MWILESANLSMHRILHPIRTKRCDEDHTSWVRECLLSSCTEKGFCALRCRLDQFAMLGL
jgi:hypothetical protein